ncbi:MAG: thermonuclease family protein, partial [Chloroflexia bacterium]|nr:thermonuclease family protein [Chloroflexia bacterium]
ATLESQPASVNPGTTPEQSLASGTFRYTITGASRGETVPELPEINSVGGYGEWVVLSVYGENWSDTEQVFDMSEFQLFADGEEILIDVGNEWVGGLLGYTPAYGNTDAILWAADEGHEFALTFLAPPGAQQLTLVAGDQAIDLSAALTEPRPLAQNASNAIQPEHIEVDVVEVVDAETIVIELDGIEQTVRYLGLDVPTDDDCYADDATALNRDLVEGKTVRLERQATDVDARGNWVRDVWAPAADGRFFLVSEELVSEGAATVGISEPNTRYEGWLLGSQSVAKAEQRGLWGACAGGVGEIATSPQVVAPRPDRITALRKPPMHITRIS